MAFGARIVETLVPIWPLLDHASRARVERSVSDYVRRAIAIAPFHIRAGVAIVSAAIGFALAIVSIGAGGPWVRARRAAQLYEVLQRLPGPQASVVRLYRSMTLLAFYEQPEVARLLLLDGASRPREAPQ